MADQALIRRYLLELIRSGSVAPDERLPSRGSVMRRFHAARKTVDRAFRHLEDEGFIYSIRGSGSYVAQPADAGSSQVVVVSPASGHALPADDPQHPHRLLRRLAERLPVEAIEAADIEARFGDLTRPGTRMIWTTPAVEHYGLIDRCADVGVPQFLVNRRSYRHAFVRSDLVSGLGLCIDRIGAAWPDIAWALFAPPVDIRGEYWLEREVCCMQLLVDRGILPQALHRPAAADEAAVLAAVPGFLDALRPPVAIFLPHFFHLPLFQAALRARGWRVGNEVVFLMAGNSDDDLARRPGHVFLDQDWPAMYDAAAAWALAGEARGGGVLVPMRPRNLP